MRLPKREEVIAAFPAAERLDIGIFDHPIVVISEVVQQGHVDVLIVSHYDSRHVLTVFES